MYELEIMVAGYTTVVVTASTVISKCFYKSQVNKLKNELCMFKIALNAKDAEIERLKLDIKKLTGNHIKNQ